MIKNNQSITSECIMPHIETVTFEEAEGDLKEIYESLIESRGKLAEVHKIHSLNPDVLVAHMELYLSIMFGKSPLRRYQREMIGVVVSAANECDYCVNHHEQALLAYWKNEERTKMLSDPGNRKNAELSECEFLLCQYADQLTKAPAKDTTSLIQEIRKSGLTDRAILDATQVIAYFNFVNRMVLGLGVSFTEEEIKGYKY